LLPEALSLRPPGEPVRNGPGQGSSEQVMPRATVLFRDEILGARPKASLDGLPGLVTTEIARQSAVPSGSD